ncbi:hypothetical protein L9F63_027700 [Diploptera punctata]|uniref:Phosphatidylcholine transfer protein n=1 Tax=Diploptera punctata TaxID=6984 RepID=A0AAD8A7A2_DIPPU|nr:hypothetical protein L9F63_027700 [Diploptera punctata]
MSFSLNKIFTTCRGNGGEQTVWGGYLEQVVKRNSYSDSQPSMPSDGLSDQMHPTEGVMTGNLFLKEKTFWFGGRNVIMCQGLYLLQRYEEITAEDFMKVQVDTDFRMLWDNTAVNLKVVEKDTCSNSDIVYWEMQWPRLFSNRDYVYNRRYLIDEEKNTIVIINKGTNHPNIPTKPDNHRVTDYWSIMVIRADNSIDKPGMEFSLTYFDNPGVSVPSSVATWIAMSGLPDFQIRLRQAARDYKLYNHDIEFNRPKEDNLGSSQPTSDTNDEGNPPDEPSPEQPVPTQVNASNSSLMYLKQFHVWQLFV